MDGGFSTLSIKESVFFRGLSWWMVIRARRRRGIGDRYWGSFFILIFKR